MSYLQVDLQLSRDKWGDNCILHNSPSWVDLTASESDPFQISYKVTFFPLFVLLISGCGLSMWVNSKFIGLLIFRMELPLIPILRYYYTAKHNSEKIFTLFECVLWIEQIVLCYQVEFFGVWKYVIKHLNKWECEIVKILGKKSRIC